MSRPNGRRVALPMQTRAGSFVPTALNAEARTAEIVWSTGAAVRRSSWDGEDYEEQLSLDPAHVDLNRLNGGAPVLNAHGAYDLGDVIGVVERAWISDNGDAREGRAVIRFSERADVDPIWQDVRSGIIRNVSIGYDVRRYEVSRATGQATVFRAIDWEPAEISLVPVGADPGAGTRSRPAVQACILQEIRSMSDPSSAADEAVPTDAAPAVPPPAEPDSPAVPDVAEQVRSAVATALAGERARIVDIRTRCAAVHLPPDFADGLIARGLAAEHVGDAIVDELAKRGGRALPPSGAASEPVTHDPQDLARRARARVDEERKAGRQLSYAAAIQEIVKAAG